MKNLIDGPRIANGIRMHRSSHKGSFLIVEGDTDVSLYEHFVDKAYCQVHPGENKDNVISAIDILEKGGFKGVVAIVDADFWHLESYIASNKNLFMTDQHDIENMILLSPAFNKIISEYFEKRYKKTSKLILDKIAESCKPLGYLRWISSKDQDNLELNFKDLKFEVFIDDKSLSIDIKKMIKDVLLNSTKKLNADEQTLEKSVISKMNLSHDVWQVCCGKDLINILSIGIKNIYGKDKYKRKVDVVSLQGILRVAYEYSHFMLTKLYKSISDWEIENSAYKIWKQV
ncbi:MAG: DUF4435 domain-containing protein [Nitrospirae bacterium]|nr:DUF4435 domain-containing protein [Nitrospirota bacterium]